MFHQWNCNHRWKRINHSRCSLETLFTIMFAFFFCHARRCQHEFHLCILTPDIYGKFISYWGKDYLAFVRTWKVMFHRLKLYKQKDDVDTLLTTNEIQFPCFISLLPTLSLSLILCISSIVRARTLCLPTCQVVIQCTWNNIPDAAGLIKHYLWSLAGF